MKTKQCLESYILTHIIFFKWTITQKIKQTEFKSVLLKINKDHFEKTHELGTYAF